MRSFYLDKAWPHKLFRRRRRTKRECRGPRPFAGVWGVPTKTFFFLMPPQAASQIKYNQKHTKNVGTTIAVVRKDAIMKTQKY